MRNGTPVGVALRWLAVGLLIACGGGGTTTAPNCDVIAGALVTRVDLLPATATLNLGDSLQVQATAVSCAGPVASVATFQWRTSDATIATVAAAGLVTPVKSGSVLVYAAAQGKEGSAALTVQIVPVARVTVEPATASVGVGRTSRLTVHAYDAQGRVITGRTATWASANAAVASIGTAGDVTGVAAGGPVAMTATIDGKSASAQVTVVLVAVSSVTVTPATVTVAAGSSAPLAVTLKDDLGTVLTGRAVSWTSSDATLATVTPAGGVVTGLKPGTVTLTATSEGKSGTAQATVTLGAPAKLLVVQQPSPVQVGAAITPPITIQVLDAGGNVLPAASTTITVALVAANGAVLGGTLTVSAVAGLATFAGLTVSAPGTFALTATAAGLTAATSASFIVTAAPAVRVAFVQQPLSAIAGSSLGSVTVQLLDATGARVSGQPLLVSLTIGTNAGNGTLSGTVSQTTVNGLATFSGLSINHSGRGYTLAAAATGLAGATSAPFDITPGAPSQLAFITQPCPTGCTEGQVLTPAPQVAVQDALGNTATGSTAIVTLTLQGQQNKTVLIGTTRVPAIAGIATFPLLSINRASANVTLNATSAPLTPKASAPFTIGN